MYRPATAPSILLGILSVVIGIWALAWPGITVLAIVLLFAIFAFSRSFVQAAHAFRSRAVGSVLGHVVLALIDLAAGAFAALWPAPTALVLVLMLGTGTVGLVGRVRATHATASAKSSRTRRNFKSVRPTVVVATSIASLHHPEQQAQLQRPHPT